MIRNVEVFQIQLIIKTYKSTFALNFPVQNSAYDQVPLAELQRILGEQLGPWESMGFFGESANNGRGRQPLCIAYVVERIMRM